MALSNDETKQVLLFILQLQRDHDLALNRQQVYYEALLDTLMKQPELHEFFSQYRQKVDALVADGGPLDPEVTRSAQDSIDELIRLIQSS